MSDLKCEWGRACTHTPKSIVHTTYQDDNGVWSTSWRVCDVCLQVVTASKTTSQTSERIEAWSPPGEEFARDEGVALALASLASFPAGGCS